MNSTTKEEAMAETWKNEDWARTDHFWYSGKTSRRRFVGLGVAAAGALGAVMLVEPPWRTAFGQAKPLKVGTLQPLSGTAAAGGKTALVGVQMAVDRINKAGGIGGRPIELLIADYESKPDVGRRKAEKLVVEDKIDVHAGGYLSNVCLACMPVYEEHKLVNMITVCLDTTITTTKCSRYTFRPFDFAPAQAVAAGPFLVNKIGKKWHIAYADYAWGQSTRDAYVEAIKKNGGEVVGTTGIPLGTQDMTPFLSKISGSFDGLFGIFFGPQGISFVTQTFDLGMSKKYRIAGDGAIAVPVSLPAIGAKGEGFVGLDRYVPVLEGVLNTPAHKKFLDDALPRLKAIDPTGPLPDRYVQSNFEGVNALKLGMQRSGFRGREDTTKLIEALEGLEMKEGDDFPQGDKLLRKEDHQAFLREFIFELRDMKHKILEVVPREKTVVPAACKFA
jgi:branched-chain amino acid transport system substrate-binding protein